METSQKMQEIVRCGLSIFNKLSGYHLCGRSPVCVCFSTAAYRSIRTQHKTNQVRWLILKMHAFRPCVLRQHAIEPPLWGQRSQLSPHYENGKTHPHWWTPAQMLTECFFFIRKNIYFLIFNKGVSPVSWVLATSPYPPSGVSPAGPKYKCVIRVREYPCAYWMFKPTS